MDKATGLGRLAAYIGLLILLSVAGNFAASFLPRVPLGWVELGMATAAALLAGWIVLARLDRRSPAALGFALSRDVPREIGLGLAVGGALILIASTLNQRELDWSLSLPFASRITACARSYAANPGNPRCSKLFALCCAISP